MTGRKKQYMTGNYQTYGDSNTFSLSSAMIDCSDLYILYKQNLQPIINLDRIGYDVEKLLMGCLENLLTKNSSPTENLWHCGLENHVSTEVLDTFFEKLSMLIDCLIKNIDENYIKGNMLEDIVIHRGYNIEIRTYILL